MLKGYKKGQLPTHCKHGHEFTPENTMIRRRNRGRGEEISRFCRKCHQLANKKYQSKPEVKERYRINIKNWRKTNKDYTKNARLKSTYNITLAEYNKMLEDQDNKCLICGKEYDGRGKYFAVDHDHKTGFIRGILCSRCNRSLGWYESCKDGINKYLNKFSKDE